jgi:hypothetical protein
MEENEMTTKEVSGGLSVTDGNVELSTTRGIGEVPKTEENKEVPVLKTETYGDSRTEEYGEVSTTKRIGEVLIKVSISDAGVQVSTTKGNGDDSSSSTVTSATVLIVCACVAILLGICLATSLYYWRKLQSAGCSENAHSVNFHGRLSETNESGNAFAESTNPLTWQPHNLLQEEPNISLEMEPLHCGTSETGREETRL